MPQIKFCQNKDWISCKDGKTCLPQNWFCDDLKDCEDGSDEDKCVLNDELVRATTATTMTTTTTKITTSLAPTEDSNPWDIIPKNGQECLTDEFQCKDGSCISSRWICDGLNDCDDESDEKDCNVSSDSEIPVSEIPSPQNSVQSSTEAENNFCQSDQFQCKFEAYCIPVRWLCDKQIECQDGSDEIGCDAIKVNF